jgi:hypothetical protein
LPGLTEGVAGRHQRLASDRRRGRRIGSCRVQPHSRADLRRGGQQVNLRRLAKLLDNAGVVVMRPAPKKRPASH